MNIFTREWKVDICEASVQTAVKNVQRNELNDRICVELVKDDHSLPISILSNKPETKYALSMCNPPFYAQEKERVELRANKSTYSFAVSLLKKEKYKKCKHIDAKNNELYTKGGEEGFIKRMIDESVQLGQTIL